MRIAVLSGGDSPEREVSIRSGKAVSDALIQAGIDVIHCDPIRGLEGLLGELNSVDAIFPILHGKNGEDGVVQEFLEKNNLRFLGSGSEASKIASDKVSTHNVLEKNGIRMPTYEVVSTHTFQSSSLSKKPYVLKPINGGSTIDTIIAREVNDSQLSASKALLKKYPEMLLEELISGLEITVPILGDKPLSAIAIIPPENAEFDYENKYNGKTQEICPIPNDVVSAELQQQAQEIAIGVHRALSLRHMSRIDIMISSVNNELVVLEANTIPGLSNQSLFPKAAAVEGLDMEKLVQEFVTLALAS